LVARLPGSSPAGRNSFGRFALPLRMISVCGSNTFTSLSVTCVSLPSTRALVGRMTCSTRPLMVSSCCRNAWIFAGRRRLTSAIPRFAGLTIWRVPDSSFREACLRRGLARASFGWARSVKPQRPPADCAPAIAQLRLLAPSLLRPSSGNVLARARHRPADGYRSGSPTAPPPPAGAPVPCGSPSWPPAPGDCRSD
jgi:hypothetical protein